MSVYVDPVFQWCASATREGQARRVGARHGHRWCHMVGDTTEELDAMADRIGLMRAWRQGDHYDLTPTRRREAVRLGAIEITSRQMSEMVNVKRKARVMKRAGDNVSEL